MKQFFLVICATAYLFTSEPAASGEHFRKGLEYYKANASEKAGYEFSKELETNSSHAGSKKMLEKLEQEIYQDEPEAAYKDVVKEFFYKGLAHFRAEDKEKALAEWEQGLALSPKNKQLLKFCVLVRKDSSEKTATPKAQVPEGRKKQKAPLLTGNAAAVTAEKTAGFKKRPDEKKTAALYYEGLRAYQQGELKKAVDIWEQVLKLDPDLSKAKKNLVKAKNQLKQGE
jgi:tetratricopeptide (TPR) repeat protein